MPSFGGALWKDLSPSLEFPILLTPTWQPKSVSIESGTPDVLAVGEVCREVGELAAEANLDAVQRRSASGRERARTAVG